MKIVYVIDHLRADGTQRALHYLARGLSDRGYDQTVLSLNNSYDTQLSHDLMNLGIEIRVIGKPKLILGVGILELLGILWKNKPDIVVTFLFYSDVLGRILGKFVPTKGIISSIRARNVNYKWWQRSLERLTLPLADAIVFNSRSLSRERPIVEGSNSQKIHVIPNGVPIVHDRSQEGSDDLRDELGVPADCFLICSVGRLSFQKGFDVLIRAFAMLAHDDVHLILVGQGDERTNLLELANRLRVDDRVHFPGFRRDVITRILPSVDLYVQSSRFEGMPNSLLEAMATGRPVIATAVDGNQELIQDGFNGWLVAPDDESALASTLEIAITNPQIRNSYGIEGRRTANYKYGIENMVNRWDRLFRRWY